MGRKKATPIRSGTADNDDALIDMLLSVCNSKPFRYQTFDAADSDIAHHYRELLTEAARSRATLANRFIPIGMKLLKTMTVLPTIEFGDCGFTLGYQHRFPTLESALNYGVMLLLDVSKPYGAALSRCKRSTCETPFYLAKRHPQGGPANRSYCSQAHRDEARTDRYRDLAARKHK